ncbi:hypothetical protein [Methanocalculus alkaliphilus]|uniref:hypothetical protein n=1 Tax=Methanocalculus alkaliphilus TaxID=768730 RepID=UPI0034507B46
MGTGYVGFVTGVCFAVLGYEVTLVAIDSTKVDALKGDQSSIYEPRFQTLIQKNQDLIRATTVMSVLPCKLGKTCT